jgi:hypothetical protein
MKESTPTTPRAPAPQHEAVRAATQFLLWARANGFAVTKVMVEDFQADLADFRIADADAKTDPDKPAVNVHDALADDYGLPRPSDAVTEDEDDDE